MSFQSVDEQLFYKSPKPNDPRLGDVVHSTTREEALSLEPAWVIAGYPDDEGVKFNFGRPGAAEAPDAIRRQLYRLCQRDLSKEILDIGNFQPTKTLGERHFQLKKELIGLYSRHQILSFGGGHDYAYPDVSAFLESLPKDEKALVINVDAHLDVRQPNPEPHSGTPFYRLLEEYDNFTLVQFGIQKQAASLAHENYCKEKKVIVIPFEERAQASQRLAEYFKSPRPCFLSLDIDGFSSGMAPGCSAAWPLGLIWQDFEPLFNKILTQSQLKGMGIYEVAPPLDENDKTSKLAASIAYRVLSGDQ